MRKHATGKKRKLYAQFLRFLPVAGLRFTFYAFYPTGTAQTATPMFDHAPLDLLKIFVLTLKMNRS